jgi:sugar lactone lactonase YvrE
MKRTDRSPSLLWTIVSASALLAAAEGALLPEVALAQRPAREVTLGFPVGLAILPDGDIIFSERRTHRIQRLDLRTGLLRVIAGTGEAGFDGDGGPASHARLSCPDAIDVDGRGNIFIADRCNERIRRIDAATGVITTIAGNGTRGPAPDGPALTSALFIDTDAHRVRLLDLRGGAITTIAGNGEEGFAGDGGPARAARFARPHVALRLRNGELLIGDSFNHRLRLVDRAGIVRTIAGNGVEGAAVDGAPALESPLLYFGEVHELADGALLFSEWGSSQIVRLDPQTNRLAVVAGSTAFGEAGPDGPALGAALGSIVDFAIDAEGRLVVAAASAGLIRRIDLARGTVETLAGTASPR